MPFMIKTEGGPHPGVRFCDNLEAWGLEWPFPEILPGEFTGGKYVKISESQLPPEAAEHPNVGVGALYEWRPDDA